MNELIKEQTSFPTEEELLELDSITADREAENRQLNAKAVNITIEESKTAYLSQINNYNTRRAKDSDLKAIVSFLNENGINTLGDLGKISGLRLNSYFEGFLNLKLDSGASVMTVQRYKGSIKEWFRFMNRHFPNLITVIPVLDNDKFKAYYSKGTTPSLTYDQWYGLKSILKRPLVKDHNKIDWMKWVARVKYKTLCITALLLGGRRLSEMLILKWKDVDFDGMTVTVNPAKKRTDKAIVMLPMNDQLSEQLQNYKKELNITPNPDHWIFPRSYQEPTIKLTPQAVDKALKKFGKQAGIEKMSFHMLRVTFITWNLELGHSMSELLNATLHSDPKMIRYYDRTQVLKTSSILKMVEI